MADTNILKISSELSPIITDTGTAVNRTKPVKKVNADTIFITALMFIRTDPF